MRPKRGALNTVPQAENRSFLPKDRTLLLNFLGRDPDESFFRLSSLAGDAGASSTAVVVMMLHLPSQIIEGSLRKNHHFDESKNECKGKLVSSQDVASNSISSSPVDLSLASLPSISVTIISGPGVGRSAQSKPTSINGTRQLLRRWQRGHRNSPRFPPSRRSLSLSSRWETDLRYDSQQMLWTAWPHSVT